MVERFVFLHDFKQYFAKQDYACTTLSFIDDASMNGYASASIYKGYGIAVTITAGYV
ncbi:MAG: hypothetical protein LJE83_13635 [Gammaproteobacteria bacterium]|jgi:hypothetical protein|nr:hypothetical protein [Gammaproteobacteria bacterium]